MTISTQIAKRIYQGDGETRVWEIDFPVLSASDLQVLVTSADGTESVVSTGYEVDLTQGKLTYPTVASGLSVLTSAQHITLLRVTPPTQSMNLTQQGVLDAEELENGYDKLTLQVQELLEKTDRCIKYTASSGKTGADAAAFLNELSTAQTTALSNALASVAQTQTTLEQAVSSEATSRQNADLSLSQQIQTLSGLVSQRASEITAEATARQSADTALQTSITNEATARSAADQTLSGQINQLNFIQFVATLPETGNNKYLYVVAQEATDLENYPLVTLYVWNATDSAWNAIGAFSTNLDADALLTKTEAGSTYLTQTNAASTYISLTQKAAANGVATLDSNTLIPATQIPTIDGGNANA